MKSWNSAKHPIYEANQMPVPIHWNPMNEDWKMRLQKPDLQYRFRLRRSNARCHEEAA